MNEPNPMIESNETDTLNEPVVAASVPSDELRNVVEAALLVAGQPLTLDKLAALFPPGSQPARDELRAVLQRLDEEYAGRGIELKKIDQSWRLQTRLQYAPYIARLSEERPARYSRALLETLAIVAYRQPCTRGDIEEIRGVAVSTELVKTLLDRGWVRQVGTREVPGRPALYATTREFLEHFNLSRLDDLPSLAELRDIGAIGAELEQREQIGQQPLALPQAASAAELQDDSDGDAGDPKSREGNPQGFSNPVTHTADEHEMAALSHLALPAGD